MAKTELNALLSATICSGKSLLSAALTLEISARSAMIIAQENVIGTFTIQTIYLFIKYVPYRRIIFMSHMYLYTYLSIYLSVYFYLGCSMLRNQVRLPNAYSIVLRKSSLTLVHQYQGVVPTLVFQTQGLWTQCTLHVYRNMHAGNKMHPHWLSITWQRSGRGS